MYKTSYERLKVMHKKILNILLVFGILIFATNTNAEIKTFLGVGEHYIEDSKEDLEKAKNEAKLSAERDAMEQAQVNVQSYSETHNSNLTKDEIIAITAGIMNVVNVKYFIKDDSGIPLIRAEVTAEIDTDKISELVEIEVQRRKMQN